MKRMLKDNKGISPVIATVIIVAVTIAVAIAVAFWMGGLVNIFTRFEKLEISSAYADPGFTITLNFKNTGSAAATISDVFINGKPASTYTGVVTTAIVEITKGGTAGSDVIGPKDYGPAKVATVKDVSCDIGAEGELVISATSGTSPFISGVSVEVTIHTSAGKDYPKVVVLP